MHGKLKRETRFSILVLLPESHWIWANYFNFFHLKSWVAFQSPWNIVPSLHKTFKTLNGLAFNCLLSPHSLIASPVVISIDSLLNQWLGKCHEGFGHKLWAFSFEAPQHLAGQNYVPLSGVLKKLPWKSLSQSSRITKVCLYGKDSNQDKYEVVHSLAM